MLIGVDVGTGSARAGVFDTSGKLLGTGKHPVTLWQEPGEIVEQSSDQIWQAVCAAVREALETAAVDPATVTGIGFDATCSLVAVGDRGQGLPETVTVAAALIDAHAGELGTLGVTIPGSDTDPTHRLAYIFGTSACSMASTRDATPVPGVWGPCYDARLPGLWLNEGGQSAAGAALDHLVNLHRDAAEVALEAGQLGRSLIAHVAAHAETLGASLSDTIRVAGDMVVVPEFLGNRSPFAEPEARAVISGLGLDRGIESLAALYLAGLSGIGYGLRQLLDRLQDRGIAIKTIGASGGAAQSALVCQMIADATGRSVALPEAQEPVHLGSAMLVALAGGTCGTLDQAMTRMSGPAHVFHPAKGDLARLHGDRYACFESLQTVARQFRQSQHLS